MKKKIIHICCHSFENDETRDYHVFGNWTARLARNILEYSDQYENEAWYAIHNLDKKTVFTKGKISYKLFPAKILHPALNSFFSVVKCPSLTEQLQLENPQNTIVHFQGERGTLLHEILSKFPEFKITIQYHGYGQPPWLEWVEKLLIRPFEKKNFPNVSHFFVHIKKRLGYLKNELHIKSEKISYQNVGIDFNLFKPRNKKEIRNKLNLPLDKFILLYVGHMLSSKGVDKIIKAYKMLKKKYSSLYLLFVGAKKSDPLYYEAVNTADKVVGVLNNKLLPYYYNAADLYCFFGDAKTVNYAGPGTASMEALASNINVVSTNLIHFPDTIVNKIGVIPKNFEDFVSKIEFFIRNPYYKSNSRRLVEKYTAYSYQTTHLLKVYDQLLTEKN